MKKITILFLFVYTVSFYSQTNDKEQFPKFKKCNQLVSEDLKNCFYTSLQEHFIANFQVPQTETNYKGTIATLFEVDTLGKFKVLYIESHSDDLKKETKRVFSLLETVSPATFLGKKTYAKYSISIPIPLDSLHIKSNNFELETNSSNSKSSKKLNDKKYVELKEYDDIQLKEYKNAIFKGKNNIPFSHLNYTYFDQEINQLGSNNHTASKPYSYAEVAKYYNFEQQNKALSIPKSSWLGKKLYNENLVAIQGDSYWFTINPILNVDLGKDTSSDENFTYVNTRGVHIQGQIGEEINFNTSIYESQGLFADYYNDLSRNLKPSGGNPAIIPGIGIAKEFKENAFDFPLAEANIKFSPSEHFDLQLGYNRNFIGDGYRSVLQGDAVSPYPFFKINTTFWKIKYTNTYMWLKDVRPEATVDGTYATKFMANHYLSWNVTKKLNLGFFESVVWGNTNDRGFDANFINPIIFYRAVEFSSSSKTGNALLGLTSKYKFNNYFHFYAQFLVDEFSIGDVKAGNKSWKNKFAYQLGVKYYNAFKINNLTLQVEYNHVRPYVYSHSNVLTNYGHNNLSMGHNWGANFKELIAIASYRKDRYYLQAKLIIAQRGLDFNDDANTNNYGGNIYLDYDDNRPFDEGVKIAQGNKTNVLLGDFQAGYILNTSSNMKLFTNLLYRNFSPNTENLVHKKNTTTWFTIGVKTDLFNWYFDY